MIYFFEAIVFVGYSFLAPIITAGGGLLVANVLTLGHIDLIRAAGLTSVFFLFNAFIVVYVFRKDVVWSEVKRFLPLSLVGSILGALFLVNVSPPILLFLMFCFSVYFIYKKITIPETNTSPIKDPFYKEQGISFFSGVLQGSALPGGGFRNAYFLSKGFTLQQMHGTTNLIGIFLWIAKITTLISATILTTRDFIGIVVAFPFLIISNILLRRGLIKFSKKTTDVITITSMSLFSVYALAVIGIALF